MNVITVLTGELCENCYIIVNNNYAVVIDPGADFDKIDAKLIQHNISQIAILLTHGHFDHCNECAKLQQKYSAKVYMSQIDHKMIENGYSLAHSLGQEFNQFTPNVFVEDGQTISVFGMDFLVMLTPGHTAGSLCFIHEDCIFSGDTLFYLSVGRSDFPTGDFNQLMKSIHNLFSLEQDFLVYPGHDRPTKLSFERENNPYA